MVRLVDHEVVVFRQQAASNLGVGEEQGVVYDDEVGGLGFGPGAVDVAVLFRAVNPDAVERIACDARPPHLLAAIEAQLGAIPALGRVQPGEDLQLEHELVGVLAGIDQVAAPASQGDIVGASLEQASLEVPGQPLAQARQIFDHQLLLERVRVGRDHHPLSMADGPGDRGHQVGQALARAGARLDDQRPTACLDLGYGEEHLQLRLAVLVTRQQVGKRPLRPEQPGEGGRIVGGLLRRSTSSGGVQPDRGRRLRVGVRRGQRIGEEAGDGPLVGGHEGEHGFLQAFVERGRLLPQSEEELARRVGVVQGPVRPGLGEAHLGREQGQAVAHRRGQEDPRDVERVQDLQGGIPQTGGLQELDVKAGSVADRLAAAQEIGQVAKGCARAGGSPQLVLFDPGQTQHGVRHGPAGIDQLLER